MHGLYLTAFGSQLLAKHGLMNHQIFDSVDWSALGSDETTAGADGPSTSTSTPAPSTHGPVPSTATSSTDTPAVTDTSPSA
ncbi:hypothetical protein D9758_010720 [Tetrapyrgos nigripes]|uniref:Uncharacterized protein n=1 Tax=Tetrapyrgos nigripes TaxID=182062 RepID=A0A8H5D6F0_9AGAR|nr:hypothetical protein D9758_010720 [Tetrapyrgos nigripes]